MSGSVYDPNGKGQWVLAELECGPLTPDELFVAADLAGIRKVHFVMVALLDDEFVVRAYSHYQITDLGREALETLRSGRPAYSPYSATPTVRVFGRAA